MQKIKELIAFLKTRAFWLNFGAAVLFLIALITICNFALSAYTNHDEAVSVPDLRGKTINQIGELVNNSELTFAVSDSVYREGKAPLTILDQEPEPNMKVKPGRIIYLTIVQLNPPKIQMPDLRDETSTQAQLDLETVGLKLGSIIYQPDIANDAVLDQLYKGKSIQPATLIPKGSNIDLVVGNGSANATIHVPDVVGLKLSEAKFVLEGSSLNMGAVISDNSVSDDTMEAYVYRQNPGESTPMSIGDAVDLFVTNDPSKVPQNSELQPIIPITKPQLKTSQGKTGKPATKSKKHKSKKHKPSSAKDTTHVN